MDRAGAENQDRPLNLEELTARCLGHMDFVQRILAKFQARFGEDLEELEEGLAATDADRVAEVAHRMKGAAANVAAPRLREEAAAVEQLARGGRLAGVPPHVHRIRNDWTRFVEHVAALDL